MLRCKTMSAAPQEVRLSKCCISGRHADGQATGRFESVGGSNCYVARSPSGSTQRAVIFNTDVFGNVYINSQLLADAYAKALDAIVIVPDWFDGEPLDSALMESIVQMNQADQNACTKCGIGCGVFCSFCPFICSGKLNWERKIPMITDIIAALRSTEFCVRKIGMIGFCYGVPATLRFCQQTKIPDNQQWLIDAGVSNHGQIRVPEDIDELCKPFMFICADKDWAFSDEQRRRAEDMLKQRSNAGDYEFHDYPGCWHGFTVRGDNDDEVVRKGKVDAFEKTVAFFEKYL